MKYILALAVAAIVITPQTLKAQFNPGAAGTFSSNIYNSQDTTYVNDTTYKPSFTFKKYFRSLAHKDTMTLSNVMFGAMFLPGTGQIYNRDYWKVPVVYAGLGASVTGAVLMNRKYKSDGSANARKMRNLFVYAAAATYWGQLMDANIRYKSYDKHLPARASFYSALLPGLGQAYNGDYWHIPLYYGGFMVSGYCWAFNQKQYKRYRHYLVEMAEGTYEGQYTQENLIWYRDTYRRNRDYSVIATVIIYILNVIDANVFAHFANFDISDDISFNVAPAIIPATMPEGGFYGYNPATQENKLGFTMNITF